MVEMKYFVVFPQASLITQLLKMALRKWGTPAFDLLFKGSLPAFCPSKEE